MQLQLNAKDAKIKEIYTEKKKYKEQQTKIIERLNEMKIEERQAYQIQVSNRKMSPDRGQDKLGLLLDEVNDVYTQNKKQYENAPLLIDMQQAKKVMKSMSKEQ